MIISIFVIANMPVNAAAKIRLNKTKVTLQAGESNHPGETDLSERRKETDRKFFLQGDGPKEGAKLRENSGRILRYAGAETKRAGRRHFFREPNSRGEHIQGEYTIHCRADP